MIILKKCVILHRLDETCSHMAAILFKVQAAVLMGMSTVAGTSKACAWNQAFRRNMTPCKVQDMNFSLWQAKDDSIPDSNTCNSRGA